jgi:hypothetical protein
VPRAAAIAILCSLLAACGAERVPTRADSGGQTGAQATAASEPLTPEIAELLRRGPGGPVRDDFGLDLESEQPLALGIVLDSPSR